MMKHKPYPKYKPSGIDWIGDIPEGWSIQRLKWAFETMESGNREIGGGSLLDNGIFSLGGEHVGWYGEIFTESKKYISEEYFARMKSGKIREGDILFVKDGATIGKCAFVENIPDGKAAVNEHVFLIRPSRKYFGKYLFYFLWAHIGQEQFKLEIKGAAQPGLSSPFKNYCWVPLSNKEDQQQIANFLDHKTAQIDDLVQKKEKMIKLLKEKRAAIINQAVTKGLDSNAKMKPSGIDWIGNIPAGWEVKKLAYISDIVLGKMLTPNDKGAYYLKYYLRAKNLGWLSTNVDDFKEMWFSSRELKIYRLQKDDLLVSEGGEVGRTCIWNDELEECYIQNSVNRVRVKKRMIAKYFLYQFYALGYGGYFESIVNRISIGHLTKEKLSSVKFLVPPEEAQQQIADFLDQRTVEIDGLIQKIESAIAKLREYRSSLITAAVTGKIDVRGK